MGKKRPADRRKAFPDLNPMSVAPTVPCPVQFRFGTYGMKIADKTPEETRQICPYLLNQVIGET